MLKLKLFFEAWYSAGRFLTEFKEQIGETLYTLTEPKEEGGEVVIFVPEDSRTRIFETLKAFPIALQKPLNP